MEKVSHIVITKKDAKKLEELKNLFALMGFNPDDVFCLLEENQELKKRVSALEEELNSFKEDAKESIRKELNQIAVNVHNEVTKQNQDVQKKMETYLFKGNRINESY